MADGTRAETLEKARELEAFARRAVGDLPFLLLVNKADLEESWEVGPDVEAALAGWTVLRTSAKTGAGVEEAFLLLARHMLEGER